MAKKEETKEKSEQEKQPLEFFQETKAELGKIVWPSRQQLLSESAAVILMVTLVATVIYVVDNFFVWVSGRVFG
ncbi:MAG: preprotein translocase subunit SecE [Cyanophyceae cyanobacterium]